VEKLTSFYLSENELFSPHKICFGILFLVGLDLNLGLCTCKTGTLPLELHLQFLFVCLFVLKQGLVTYSRLTSNSQSSCLCLPNAGVTNMYHHVRLKSLFTMVNFKRRQAR
jgi:hypothetical protein